MLLLWGLFSLYKSEQIKNKNFPTCLMASKGSNEIMHMNVIFKWWDFLKQLEILILILRNSAVMQTSHSIDYLPQNAQESNWK